MILWFSRVPHNLGFFVNSHIHFSDRCYTRRWNVGSVWGIYWLLLTLTNTETALFHYAQSYELPPTNTQFKRRYMFLFARLGNITHWKYCVEKEHWLEFARTDSDDDNDDCKMRLFTSQQLLIYWGMVPMDKWWSCSRERVVVVCLGVEVFAYNSFIVSRLRMRKQQFSSLESIHFLDSLRKQPDTKVLLLCFLMGQ